MRRIYIFMALSLTTLTGSALAADASSGKDLYMRHCRGCHGQNGEGNPTMEKAMKVKIESLDSKAIQSMSDADLHKVIADGKGKMPAISNLSDAQVNDVIAYIRTLKK